jgi:hypothetical protein
MLPCVQYWIRSSNACGRIPRPNQFGEWWSGLDYAIGPLAKEQSYPPGVRGLLSREKVRDFTNTSFTLGICTYLAL